MKPDTILCVDDEAIALKYFERLVGPLAPVLTATSVAQGRTLLHAHAADIAVLVCDQRMPGERGTDLLRHARQYYPNIVRIMTTAYSELGEAIDAINTGEIYRYISKPWELEHLRSDLRNALELAQLRAERDQLARDKLFTQHSQLMAQRLAVLDALGAALCLQSPAPALNLFAQAALSTDLQPPGVDWARWEYADLLQAEARRQAMLVKEVRACWQAWGTAPGQGASLGLLGQALGEVPEGDRLRLSRPEPLNTWLTDPAGALPGAPACAWIAWLLAQAGGVVAEAETNRWTVRCTKEWSPPAVDWLAASIDRLALIRA